MSPSAASLASPPSAAALAVERSYNDRRQFLRRLQTRMMGAARSTHMEPVSAAAEKAVKEAMAFEQKMAETEAALQRAEAARQEAEEVRQQAEATCQEAEKEYQTLAAAMGELCVQQLGVKEREVAAVTRYDECWAATASSSAPAALLQATRVEDVPAALGSEIQRVYGLNTSRMKLLYAADGEVRGGDEQQEQPSFYEAAAAIVLTALRQNLEPPSRSRCRRLLADTLEMLFTIKEATWKELEGSRATFLPTSEDRVAMPRASLSSVMGHCTKNLLWSNDMQPPSPVFLHLIQHWFVTDPMSTSNPSEWNLFQWASSSSTTSPSPPSPSPTPSMEVEEKSRPSAQPLPPPFNLVCHRLFTLPETRVKGTIFFVEDLDCWLARGRYAVLFLPKRGGSINTRIVLMDPLPHASERRLHGASSASRASPANESKGDEVPLEEEDGDDMASHGDGADLMEEAEEDLPVEQVRNGSEEELWQSFGSDGSDVDLVLTPRPSSRLSLSSQAASDQPASEQPAPDRLRDMDGSELRAIHVVFMQDAVELLPERLTYQDLIDLVDHHQLHAFAAVSSFFRSLVEKVDSLAEREQQAEEEDGGGEAKEDEEKKKDEKARIHPPNCPKEECWNKRKACSCRHTLWVPKRAGGLVSMPREHLPHLQHLIVSKHRKDTARESKRRRKKQREGKRKAAGRPNQGPDEEKEEKEAQSVPQRRRISAVAGTTETGRAHAEVVYR